MEWQRVRTLLPTVTCLLKRNVCRTLANFLWQVIPELSLGQLINVVVIDYTIRREAAHPAVEPSR